MERNELLLNNRKIENYICAIREYNKILHRTTKNFLLSSIPELSESDGRYALVTTGSDGRYEKSPLSPIELILLHIGADDTLKVERKIKNFCEKYNLISHFEEVKDLRFDFASNYANFPDRVFPTRALDSKLIVGNPFIAKRYKEKIIEELRAGSEGKKRLKKFNSKKRYHIGLLVNSGKEDEKHFDLNTGFLYYNGDRIKSTKYTHLRAFQYKLAFDVFRALRREKIGYDFLVEFPRPTIDRLNYLFYMKNLTTLSLSEVDDCISAYNKALYWYHLSEEEYRLNNSNIIEIDKGELKDVTKLIINFVKRPEIFSK